MVTIKKHFVIILCTLNRIFKKTDKLEHYYFVFKQTVFICCHPLKNVVLLLFDQCLLRHPPSCNTLHKHVYMSTLKYPTKAHQNTNTALSITTIHLGVIKTPSECSAITPFLRYTDDQSSERHCTITINTQ